MVGLVADIGGTNVRFAVVAPDGELQHIRTLHCARFPGVVEAVQMYLSMINVGQPVDRAAFAVASAITGDWVELTNSPWHFSISDVQNRLNMRQLHVVNDFTAVALSVPHLQATDRLLLGGSVDVPVAPIAVLGPGTGLGVSGLVPDGRAGWQVLATEGGHVTLAAQNELEDAILAQLRRKFGHVSAERVLSGPGLVNLYQASAEISGHHVHDLSPEDVTERAMRRNCYDSRQALDLFFSWLGSVAGNLALTLGARGGVYLAGGILPRMVGLVHSSAFRSSFEAKGRFQPYLSKIPVWMIVHSYPAFAGLAALLQEDAT